jgi:hypothetical protein
LPSETLNRDPTGAVAAAGGKHSRYVIFQLAEVAVPRELFAGILERIAGLREAPS